MNQNNIQGVRQVTPEEIAQVEGVPLTKEELQKTQVLNLKEFSEAVHFEKITSKKPAIIIAVIGALLIVFGTSFQVAKTFKPKETTPEPRYVPEQQPQEVVQPKQTSLTCTSITKGNPDGTDVVYTIVFNLEDEKLIGFRKSYSVSVTEGAENGPASVQSGIQQFLPLATTMDGLQVSVTPTTNGYVATSTADYLMLDLTQLSEAHQNHFISKIDFPLDTEVSKVKESMTAYGFQCE